MNFIISQVGDFINSLSPKEKEPYLKLLSLFFYNPSNNQNTENQNQNGSNSLISKNIYYIYISPVLNILQTFNIVFCIVEINNLSISKCSSS